MGSTSRQTRRCAAFRLRAVLRDHFGFFLAALTALGLLGAAAAQKIETTTWGFDGASVVVGAFNPLTVEVRNDTGAPIDDVLALVEVNGLQAVGAPIVERCYLAPGTARTVQFHPFVTTFDASWSLRWKNAVASINVPRPRVGWRATVILRDGDGPPDTRHRLPAFSAAWFPATAGAAEALGEAILDSDPEWDEPRALAFLAWLRSGGRLHVFERDGKKPQFAGPLSILDDVRQRFTIGAGTVVRYASGIDDSLPQRLRRSVVFPDDATPPSSARAPNILSDLQSSLLPNHPWGLIFTAAVAFLLCVGPVHWILARRRVDWRLSIGYLLGVVTLFTLLFAWLGARGYDEVSRLRTLAYARVCGDGEVAATQYTNAFVTGGGERRFHPRAEASLTGTAQTLEAVPGVVDNGPGGSLVVDMPMFSARGLVHRGHYRLASVPPVRLESGRERPELVVEGGGALGGFFLDGSRLYRLDGRGERLQVSAIIDTDPRLGQYHLPDSRFDPERVLPLALDCVCERLQLDTPAQTFPDRGARRAFVLMRSPPELHIETQPSLGDEESYVLYDFDLR
ncbi:MAG: hypothetical protein R3F56_23170 [Planctomycetota bacterium]